MLIVDHTRRWIQLNIIGAKGVGSTDCCLIIVDCCLGIFQIVFNNGSKNDDRRRIALYFACIYVLGKSRGSYNDHFGIASCRHYLSFIRWADRRRRLFVYSSSWRTCHEHFGITSWRYLYIICHSFVGLTEGGAYSSIPQHDKRVVCAWRVFLWCWSSISWIWNSWTKATIVLL
jgi:hypothetical protein